MLPQILFIIFASSVSLASSECVYYTVKTGDSFYTLSKGNITLLTALLKANNLKSSVTLEKGSELCIPYNLYFSFDVHSLSDVSGCKYYKVGFEGRYKTFNSLGNNDTNLINALYKANPIQSTQYDLRPGSFLCLPIVYLSRMNINQTRLVNPECEFLHTFGLTFPDLTGGGNPKLMTELAKVNSMPLNQMDTKLEGITCIPKSLYSSYTIYNKTQYTCRDIQAQVGVDFYHMSGGSGAFLAHLLAANRNVTHFFSGQTLCYPTNLNLDINYDV